MYRTKSRRNIRSKRNLSKKNRSRKNRNNRRMKGGNPGPDNDFDLAKKHNSEVLCKYEKLMADYRNNKKTKHDVETMKNELMLYQIKPNTLKPEYPNPMRMTEVMRYNYQVWSNYVDGSVECSATVI